MNSKGISVVQLGGTLMALMVVGICLPILDPFLSLGILATGGITSYLLMAVPLFLVGAVLLNMFKGPEPTAARW